MKNHPLPTKVQKYNTYNFDPTGDPSVDTPAWESLVSAVNTYTPTNKASEIVIRDNAQSMVVDTANSTPDTSEFLKGCWVRGETKNSRIQYNNGYIINWGRYGNPIRVTDAYSWFTRGTIAAMPAFTSRLSSSSITLAKGDYVLVWSTDNISGVAAHHGNSGFQRAAELHRVDHQDGGGWIIDCDVVDPLTTTPSICKIDMLRGCGMSDLTFGSNGVDEDGISIDLLDQKSCVNVQRCHGFRAENIQADDTGCGGFDLQLCADSEVAGYNGVWQFNNRRIYAVTIGVCTNVVYRDSVWHNTRHMITSFGLQVTGGDNIRYGTARGCKGVNLYQYISGDAIDTAFAGMDLHAESWGFELQDCHVYNSMYYDGGAEACFAYSTRARNTRFVNCYTHSAMTQQSSGEGYYGQVHTGWRIMANDAQLTNCHQDRGWVGVLIQPDTVNTSFIPQRTKIDKCIFENITGDVIHMQSSIASNGIEMNHSTIRNCANRYNPGGDPEWRGAPIRILGGTGHKIRYNNIDKGSNYYAIDCNTLTESDIDFKYNSVRGYGSGKIGIRGDTGDPKSISIGSAATFNTAVAAKNSTD